jgi:hypothetical protein
MLWEQFSRSQCPVSSCLYDVVQITLIVIFGRAQIPRVNASQRPRTVCVTILVDDGFASKGGQRVSVPIIRAIEDFISLLGWVNT